MSLKKKIDNFYKQTSDKDVEKAWNNAKKVNKDFDEKLKLSKY